MTANKPYYRTEGSVRGRCPHRHTKLETALRCIDSDMAGCRTQDGYSDRAVTKYAADDTPLDLTREEEEDIEQWELT